MSKTHAGAILLDNTTAVLDVNNYIPQQVIIDTGAVCVMMSKRYAVVVGVNISTLVRGIELITADGAIATSLGTTPHPLEFDLSRNTTHEHGWWSWHRKLQRRRSLERRGGNKLDMREGIAWGDHVSCPIVYQFG